MHLLLLLLWFSLGFVLCRGPEAGDEEDLRERCQRATAVSLESLRWRWTLSPGMGEEKVCEEHHVPPVCYKTSPLADLKPTADLSHPVCPLLPPAPICSSLLRLSPLLPLFVKKSRSLSLALFSPHVYSLPLSITVPLFSPFLPS